MRISFQLNAASPLQIKDFFRKLEVPVELTVQGTYRGETHYYFHRPEHSTTSFVISDDMHGKIVIGMDGLSSYDDYKFFPYLIDTLGLHCARWLHCNVILAHCVIFIHLLHRE